MVAPLATPGGLKGPQAYQPAYRIASSQSKQGATLIHFTVESKAVSPDCHIAYRSILDGHAAKCLPWRDEGLNLAVPALVAFQAINSDESTTGAVRCATVRRTSGSYPVDNYKDVIVVDNLAVITYSLASGYAV